MLQILDRKYIETQSSLLSKTACNRIMILEIEGRAMLTKGKYASLLVTCDLQSTGLIRVLKDTMLKGATVGVASSGINFIWTFLDYLQL